MRLLLLCASILVSLSLLEVGLRMLTPYPVTRTSNKTSHPRLGYVTSSDLSDVDEWGFRNVGPTLAEADIVLVGDSMVYSAGVSYRDSFAPKLAERTGRRVYSMGVGSYGVYHYAVLMNDLESAEIDDVVLVLFPANDIANHCRITSLPTWAAFAEPAGLSAPPCGDETVSDQASSLLDWLEENTAVVNGVALTLDRYRETNGPFVELPAGNLVRLRRARKDADATSFDRDDRRVVFEDSLSIIRDARRKLAAAGIRLWLVLIPSKELVFHDWAAAHDWPLPAEFVRDIAPQEELMARYAAFSEAEGIPYRDATAAVVAAFDEEIETGRTLYPTYNDGHPFARGYEAYAEATAELLATGGAGARP